jgi:hypothetical protein
MTDQRNQFNIHATDGSGGMSLIDALERDAAVQRSSPAPAVAGVFVSAVKQRRYTRWAIGAGAALVPLALVAVTAALMWPSTVQEAAEPQVATAPPKRELISSSPTAAELVRLNRGRSGDALVLPETTGSGGQPVTAGTRLDSPAAAQMIR